MCLDIILLNNISDHHLKLKKIFTKTNDIINEFAPNEIAIEAPFFSKNAQSMLKLGRAQSAAMLAGIMKNIPITEYAPKKIKMAITGRGQASKEQVAGMLTNMLSIKKTPKHLDATDGLAAAVCHHFQKETSSSTKSYSGWKAFVTDNPKKVK